MKTLTPLFLKDNDFQSIVSGLDLGMKEQLVTGLSGSARAFFIAALFDAIKRPLLVVTHNLFAAQKMEEDLRGLLPIDQLLMYPANELMVTESAIASPETSAQRIEVLSQLAGGFRGVVVVPYAGIRKIIPPKRVFEEARLFLRVGDSWEMERFISRMVGFGYERVEKVEKKGEMSVRGGIVDFYPLHTPLAYRIEWFDDEVDSIRIFDPGDQRSLEKLKEVTVIPCREIVADPERFANASEKLSELLNRQLSKMTDRVVKNKLEEYIRYDISRLREKQYFLEMYKYVPLLYPEEKTLLDYIPEDAVLILDEPVRMMETARHLEQSESEWMTGLLKDGKMLPSVNLSKPYDALLLRRKHPTLFLSLFLRQPPHSQPQNIINFTCRPMQNFHGQLHLLKAEMERWKKTGAMVYILANGKERIQRISRVLDDYRIEGGEILDGHLQNGFELPSIRLVLVTEGEIFSQKQRKVSRVDKKIENAERIKSYTELKEGDYVVHVNHGIGKFIGIGTLEINGIHKDYIHIAYAGGDKLSIPIDQIDLLQKYVGADEKEPKIHRLGGGEWAKVKNKVRNSVRDIADELIQLYAARQASPGYAFSKDTIYQKEFEAMFPYEETPDQLRAIEEIKRDMEQPRPMDRLLCGDVGYGKTEVAIRAAFKAAMDGKQVAVLVPTTILAQQHYETFRERFSGFPVTIDVLSRFRTRKEQTETLKKLRQGTIDIVIGTHRLLSNDVKFKDLGLLIVDEEQRFGVTHKEKLKKLKTNVDVLTLTATPIPRTLHMSLIGVRDLSVIETPPENRFPVQTYVVEYSDTLVREAIERELAREGQVYFLYNRVQGISQMAQHISLLVPDARVAVAHGQMSESELEKTILDFLDGEYDVLVSTSIIETGVDIPNVNTLIVYDADKMGLAQLYQLRGRVGRSNRIAYAYFTYQRDKVLTEVAEKRLQSIKEFTELGSGFKIAMRDLAIRGTGNLLGAEQHGFIASVGFDLYSQMLAEEINKRKAEMTGTPQRESEPVQTQLDLHIDAYIPSDYIVDSIQKIEIYKKVAAIRTLEDEADLYEELVDRFGEPPQTVLNLLRVTRLKVYGSMYAIESIQQRGDEIHLKIHESQNANISGQKLVALANRFENHLKVVPGPQISLVFKCKGMSAEQAVEMLEQFLVQYKEALKTKGELQNVAQ